MIRLKIDQGFAETFLLLLEGRRKKEEGTKCVFLR